ncbi:MAG: hypothetical protein HFH68_16435, partial [Lachnospiraceae bacterium]|nr:hypothetical protein [Lachnospiraceae bacterium]
MVDDISQAFKNKIDNPEWNITDVADGKDESYEPNFVIVDTEENKDIDLQEYFSYMI